MSPNDSDTSSGYDDTEPAPLDDLNRQPRIDREFDILRKHHTRIADSIHLLWGHPDCDELMHKLMFNEEDAQVRSRAGFKPEVLAAIMALANLHVVNAKTGRQSE